MLTSMEKVIRELIRIKRNFVASKVLSFKEAEELLVHGQNEFEDKQKNNTQ